MVETSDADDLTLEGADAGQSRPGVLAAAAPRAGQLFGRYVVLGHVGSGAMGSVYAAYDPELDRKLALKLLRHVADPDAARREARLLREAKAMARIAHPNVVAVHDVGVHDGRAYVAMEFIAGTTLAGWMIERRPSWSEALAVLLKAGRGLDAAHKSGLVHRDFKPANVLISDGSAGAEGRVCVTDFGLARMLVAPPTDVEGPDGEAPRESAIGSVTRDGAVLGTPGYMPPEQHHAKAVGPLADQFAFCVTLYEALYGERPFAGTTAAEILAAVTDGRVRPVPADSPVPTWLRGVVLRGLAADPSARWPTMSALLAALERDPRRRRRGIALAVGVVALGVGALGVWRLDHARREAGCERAAAAIDEVWNPTIRGEIVTRIAAVELPYAARTAELVLPWIDRHAETWKATRLEVCRSAEVERTLSANAIASANACLESGRAHLAAIIERLGEASAQDVRNAVHLAARPSVVATCGDEAWLARQPVLTAEARAGVEEIGRSILAAQFQYFRGNLARARELTDEAVEAAERLDVPTAIVDALLARARVHDAFGELNEGERRLHEAMAIATRVGADDQSARAAEQLARIVGLRQERFEAGLAWTALAEAWHDRLGLAPDAAPRIVMLEARGGLELRRGDAPAALAALQRAVDLRTATFGPDHPELADALELLGLAYRLAKDHDRALAIIEQTAEIRRTAFGDEHPDYAGALHNIGVVLASKRQFDRALPFQERALAIFERALGPEHTSVGDALINLANTHRDLGHPERAVPLQERALGILRTAHGAASHPHVALALENLGRSLRQLGRLDDAAARYTEAIEIREALAEPEPAAIATTWVDLGEVRREAGDGDGAAAAMREALAIAERATVPDAVLARARAR